MPPKTESQKAADREKRQAKKELQGKKCNLGEIVIDVAPPLPVWWNLVTGDTTRTVIPSKRYFECLGIRVGEPTPTSPPPRDIICDPRSMASAENITINLDGPASIKMMALFILDILHDNSGPRGGGVIQNYFEEHGVECSFNLMIAYILYGIFYGPQGKNSFPPPLPPPAPNAKIAGFATAHAEVIQGIRIECYRLLKKAPSEQIPSIDEKSMKNTIITESLCDVPEGVLRENACPPNPVSNPNSKNVFVLEEDEVSPQYKPLELMLDQGQSIVLSLLGKFTALHISAINRMDMGDSYRTILHIGPAIVALTGTVLDKAKQRKECGDQDLVQFLEPKTITEYNVEQLKAMRILCSLKKCINYVKTYYRYADAPVGRTTVRDPSIRDYVPPRILIGIIVDNFIDALDIGIDRGYILHRDGIEHSFILFIEENVVQPLEAAYEEYINDPIAPGTTTALNTVAEMGKIKNILRNIIQKRDTTLIIQLLTTYPKNLVEKLSESTKIGIANTQTQLIIKAFLRFKQREINRALKRNYIVHTRSVNIQINMEFNGIQRTFFRAEYSVDDKSYAKMNLNGVEFRSTFSAKEVGTWVNQNKDNAYAMQTNFTLACLAKYVGDLNQFIYGFYMGIAVASEDSSAIANAIFLMNYISSNNTRLQEFKGVETQIGAGKAAAAPSLIPKARLEPYIVPSKAAAKSLAVARAQEKAISAANARLERGMIIATTVPRGEGFGIQYYSNLGGAKYIETPAHGPAAQGELESRKLVRKNLAARMRSAEIAFNESMITQLNDYARLCSASAFTPQTDAKWGTTESLADMKAINTLRELGELVPGKLSREQRLIARNDLKEVYAAANIMMTFRQAPVFRQRPTARNRRMTIA